MQSQLNAEFPYGVDPRAFGVGKYDYERILRRHRDAEHHNVMIEQQAERDLIAEREAERDWWLRPLCAFFKWSGGAFWLVAWGYVILMALISFQQWSQERDAQWCLKDKAKCERIANGIHN